MTMNPFSEFQIVTSTPYLLVLRELPYSTAGWAGIIFGLLMALSGAWKYWRSAPSRGALIALALGSSVMFFVGLWLVGLGYTFSFFRSQSAVEIRMSWFGRTVSNQRFTYTIPPVAEIVTSPRKTHELVLRFEDGHLESMGLSTDRPGHDEATKMINQFLQTGSVVQ